MVWMAVWAALAPLAGLWPPEMSRPWPRFTRRCRAAVSQALADEAAGTDLRVSQAVFFAPGRRKVTGAGRRRPSRPPRAGKGPPDVDDDLGDLADVDTYGGGDGGD